MSGPLVTTEWLADHSHHSVLRIVDTRWYLGEPDRGAAAYREAHIPGAVFADLDNDLSAATGAGRHPLPDWDTFAERMEALGIDDSSRVVAYDDRGGAIAARLWWMLRAIGHPHAFVLDGGLAAWVGEGRPLSSEPGSYPPGRITVRPQFDAWLDRAELGEQLGSVVLLDARAGERYRGEHDPIDPVAGHIPTAVHAPYEANLDSDGRFRAADELATHYRALGVDGDRPVIAYCGSGVTACHDILAIEHAGLGTPQLYPGSWSDWSSTSGSVAVGDEPGDPP